MRPSEESHYEGTEPVRGLPEALPAGETMLWQGAPDWRSLARHAFHIRLVGLYFLVLLGWYGVSMLTDAADTPQPMHSVVPLLGSLVAVLLLISAFAWLIARTTVYTITSKRVVMRFGVTLPMTWNIPFARISSVDLKLFADGSGELVLAPMADDKFSYFVMWPHAKPWHLRHPRPNLRCIAQAGDVAGILAKALVAGGHGMASAEDVMGDMPAPEMGRHSPLPA